MRYYSKVIFRLFNSLYFLAVLSTIFTAYVFVSVAMWGGDAVQAKDKIIPASIGIVIFLLVSILVLFLQHFKYRRFGYLMFVLAPVGLYIFYKAYSYLPIMDITIAGLSSGGIIISGLIWLIANIINILVALIPFYVLIKLLKEDLFKKKQIS